MAGLRRQTCSLCAGTGLGSNLMPVQRRAYSGATDEAGPSRSIIFDKPLDHSARAQKLKRVRRLHHVEKVKASRSEEEERERLSWWNDPWYKMSRSPMRQCQITRQLQPSAFMVNFRAANLGLGRKPGDWTHPPDKASKTDPLSGTYLLPDRVLHPRFAPRKAGLGMWALCHHEVIARLSGPGAHKQYLNRTRSEVLPDLQELVYLQLCQRVEQELVLLYERLRGKNRLVDTRLRHAEAGVRMGRKEDLGRTTIRRLGRIQADEARSGQWGDERAVALFDISGLPGLRETKTAVEIESKRNEKAARNEKSDCAFYDAATLSALKIPIGVALPLVTTPKTDIPIYTPSIMFPAALHATLSELFGKIVQNEETDIARIRETERVLADKGAGPSTPAGDAIPRQAAEDALEGESEKSDMLVLSTHPILAGSDRQGDQGVDLAIAFWRLRCFLGEGWTEYDADKKGRRV